MAWVLTRGLTTVRAEFNALSPGRDKTSDGSVGDLAHQTGPSGHNPDRTGKAEYKDGDGKDEVRAIDVDRDLRSPVTMEQVIQYLVKRARAGHYVPFKYLIYNGRIWSSSTSWQTRQYTGANKHDKHAHFSGDYTQKADEWTGSLGLASLLPKKETDVDLNDKIGDPRWPNRTVKTQLLDVQAARDILVGDDKAPKPDADSPLGQLVAMVKDYPRFKAEVATLTALARGEQAEVPPSADVVAARVVALLTDMPEVVVNVTPEALQQAIVGAVHEISAPREEAP